MAESSTSSLTSTSHTLTVAPGSSFNNHFNSTMAANGGGGGLPSLSDISAALAFRQAVLDSAARRGGGGGPAFLHPAAALPTASAQFAQAALGSFAGQVGDEQQERLRRQHAATAARKKRKRRAGAGPAGGAGGEDPTQEEGEKTMAPVGPLLKIRRVHVDGFETPQIWQQSNRILAASLLQTKHEISQLDDDDEEAEEEGEGDAKPNGVASDSEDNDEEDDLSGEEDEIDGVDEEDEEDEEDEDELDEEELEALAAQLEEDEEENEGDEEGGEEDDEGEVNQPDRELVEDENGLNDGFFDIDEFNKQSQFFEDQDARADPNTDRVSDEDEEPDWHADPFSDFATWRKKPQQVKRGGAADKRKENAREQLYSDDDGEDEEEDEEDGPPIFGDMDLDAPSGESDNEDLDDLDGSAGGLASGLASGLEMDLSADAIYYKDFFAPPARKRERDDRDRPGRPSASGPAPPKSYQPDETEVQRGMNSVRRDLFEQISDDEGLSDDENSGVDNLSDVEDAGDPRARRSAHERRQAKILAEIRRLEAEAIREKNWTLAGEASAGARPLNSLLEEDLDFEHIGKPVPVATQELTEDIEAMVKRRILEQSFDEVRRRYAVDGADSTSRRGLVEIDDQQAKKGLAAVYEEEHLQTANPDTFLSQSDERLQAEEREVARLWSEISSKLDALSSWHYKPRPAAPSLTVVADAPTVAMEDAQPATAQGVTGGASMLAPQEVYKPGQAQSAEEKDKNVVVVAKSGLPVARDELTREERKRRRRRNKERIRKSGSGLMIGGVAGGSTAVNGKAAASKQTQDKQDTLAALKKAGVKVIGRRGEIQDLEGNKPRPAQAASSGNYKL